MNLTMPSSMPYSSIEATLIGLSVSVLWLLIVLGNCLVLIAISTDYRLHNVQNWFLSSLAVADLMLGVLILPMSAVNELLGRWVFGNVLCSLWLGIDVLLCTASIMHLCLISIDRYYSVIRPIQYKTTTTPSRIISMIIAAWVISAIICLPPLFGLNSINTNLNTNPNNNGTIYTNSTPIKTCQLTENKTYVLYSTIGSFYIPLLIIVLVYAQVYNEAKKRAQRNMNKKKKHSLLSISKTSSNSNNNNNSSNKTSHHKLNLLNITNYKNNKSHKLSEQFTNEFEEEISANSTVIGTIPATNGDSVTVVISSQSTANPTSTANTDNEQIDRFRSKSIFSKLALRKSKLIRHRERRTIVVLGIVVGAFIICWLPFFTSYLILVFCKTCMNMTMFNFFFWLGYVNSALNPIIYTVYNRDFRKAFQKLLSLDNCQLCRVCSTVCECLYFIKNRNSNSNSNNNN